jgi:hypothetical protein
MLALHNGSYLSHSLVDSQLPRFPKLRSTRFLLKMAKPFGIIAGAVGIAAAFTACVDCFNYIQLGRRFGRYYLRGNMEGVPGNKECWR